MRDDKPVETVEQRPAAENAPSGVVGVTGSEAPASAAAGRAASDDLDDDDDAAAAAARPAASVDFTAYLMSLYVNTLIALGEVEDPVTHRISTNLELAQQSIEIITLLRAKTHGNLSPEERSFLEQALPELQLRYVKKAAR